MNETQQEVSERQDQIAHQSIPRLRELADELESLSNTIFTKRIGFEPDNGASVMALSFVTKQREHLRSVRILLDFTSHRDALLVARTMLEGLGRLLWAFNRTPDRTELWLWYGAIIDWRQTKRNEERGIFVDPEERAELLSLVTKHGHHYLRPAVHRAIEEANVEGRSFDIPEDPWATDWTPTKIESMFIEVGGKSLYDRVYRDSSEWMHWGPRSILRAMAASETGVSGFTDVDWRAATVALQVACQSLLQSLEILDQHFALGLAAQLAMLEDRMQRALSESVEFADA